MTENPRTFLAKKSENEEFLTQVLLRSTLDKIILKKGGEFLAERPNHWPSRNNWTALLSWRTIHSSNTMHFQKATASSGDKTHAIEKVW